MRHLTRLFVRLGYVFAAVVAALYWGGQDRLLDCPPPKGATRATLADTPPALRQSLQEEIGEMAAPGEKFDATEAINTGRNRRLAFIWNEGRRWVVATEKGGTLYSDPVFAYDLAPDGGRAVLMERRIAMPDTLCQIAGELLTTAR